MTVSEDASVEKKDSETTESEEAKKEGDNSEKEPEHVEPVPTQQQLFVYVPKEGDSKAKAMMISLDGLLDYDETDKTEGSMELSLFAEMFQAMMNRDKGYDIMVALQHYTPTKPKDDTLTGQKRRRDDENDPSLQKVPKGSENNNDANKNLDSEKKVETKVEGTETKPEDKGDVTTEEANNVSDNNNGESEVKHEEVKSEEAKSEEEIKPEETKHEGEAKHEEVKLDDVKVERDEPKPENGEKKDSAEAEDGKVDTIKPEEEAHSEEVKTEALVSNEELKQEIKHEEKDKVVEIHPAPATVIDQNILHAFQFFDRTGAGFIKEEDLEIILYNLGLYLSKKTVHTLVAKGSDRGRIYFDKIAEVHVENQNEMSDQ